MQLGLIIFLCSLVAVNVNAFTSDEYQAKNIDLGALLYSNLEIEQKSCKGVGEKNPSSLIKWWDSVKNYRSSEISRDLTYKASTEEILKKIEELKHFEEAKKQIQIINLNLELVNLSINNIEGDNGRLTIRKKLLSDLEEASQLNVSEYNKILTSYNLLRDNYLLKGLETAKKACERVKNKKLDPVKGCEKAQADFKTMINTQLTEFAQVLNTEKIASIDLNDKLIIILQKLIETYAQIPNSDDSNYDWKISTIGPELINLQKYTKDAGTKCPSSVPTTILSSETTQMFSAIGLSENQDELITSFKSIWTDINSVIGGSYQRDNYFPLYKNAINDLNKYDQEYLDKMKSNKEKLENLISTLNTSLNEGNEIKPKEINELIQDTITKTSTTSSSSELAANAELNISTSSTSSAIKNKSSTSTSSTSTLSSAGTTAAAKSVSISNLATNSTSASSVINNYVKSTSSTSSTSTNKLATGSVNSSTTSSSNAIGSNGKLKKLNTSTSKNSAIILANSSSSISVSKTSTQDLISEKLKKIKTDLIKNKISTNNSISSVETKANSVSAVSTKSISKSTTLPVYESNEDKLNFQNALLNVSKENKIHYEPTDNDSIFEVVTKAYVRNLNKLDSSAE